MCPTFAVKLTTPLPKMPATEVLVPTPVQHGWSFREGQEGWTADIRDEIARRRIDRLISEAVELSALTLEYDRTGALDGRSRTRLEAFFELLEIRRQESAKTE